jgi:hypothetical protein
MSSVVQTGIVDVGPAVREQDGRILYSMLPSAWSMSSSRRRDGISSEPNRFVSERCACPTDGFESRA